MKKIRLLALVLVLAAETCAAAEATFWQQLTPEERRAAGVDQLSPEQKEAIDQLADRYARHVGERVKQETREQAKTEIRAEVKQEVRAEVKRELSAEQKTQADARAGLASAEDETVIHSRIAGRFAGWSNSTVFRLANGQVWVPANGGDTLWLPTTENPEVEIRPAALGGWKLFLTGKGYWLRVRRVQ